MSDGAPLSKTFMLKKTDDLIKQRGIQFTDHLGVRVKCRASAWRAGGVESARGAGICDPVIMAQGRWSTIAWERYSVASLKDLQSAHRIWANAKSSGVQRVGSFNPAGLLLHDPFPDHTITSIVHKGTVRKSPAPPGPMHCSSVSEVTYPERIVVGATVETKWGNAIIKVINSDGC